MAKRTRAQAISVPVRRRGRLGLAERFPVRRVILTVLSIVIILLVTVGTYKTLTLPAGHGRLSAGVWRDLVVQGVAQGAIYALIAIGYSLVYGILLMINFAHGEVFMTGAFGSFFVASSLASSGFLNSNPIAGIAVLMVVGALISAGVALLLERVAYRPLRNAPRLVPLITAIGASLFLQNTFLGLFGAQTRGYAVIRVLNGQWHPLGIPIDRASLLTIIVAVVALISLSWFVAKTKTGKFRKCTFTFHSTNCESDSEIFFRPE